MKACFKVESGDVEDAPALDPIAKFDIIERDGAVYILGEEETIKSSRKTLNIKCQAQGNEKVLVIGGYDTSPSPFPLTSLPFPHQSTNPIPQQTAAAPPTA